MTAGVDDIWAQGLLLLDDLVEEGIGGVLCVDRPARRADAMVLALKPIELGTENGNAGIKMRW